MAKYEGMTTAAPQVAAPAPPSGARLTETAYVPTYETMVRVPRAHTASIAAAWAALALFVGMAALILLDLYAEPKAWLLLIIGGALAFVGTWLRVYPRQRQAMYDLARREWEEQRDIDGDGVIGRVAVYRNWRDRPAQVVPNASEKAILLRMVEFMYRNPKNRSYDALRREFRWTNAQVSARLARLNRGELGIVEFDSAHRVVLPLPWEEARQRLENTIDL